MEKPLRRVGRSGNKDGLVMMKGSAKLVFNIKIRTENSVIFCAYLCRDHGISAIITSTSMAMSIEKAHIIIKHHDEEQTKKMAVKLRWTLKKGPMMPYKVHSVGKAKRLAIS